MLSLHVGWVLLASIAITTLARRPVVRTALAALPVLMFAATVLTANHYLIAGTTVILLGLAIATAMRSRTSRTPRPQQPRGDTTTEPRRETADVSP